STAGAPDHGPVAAGELTITDGWDLIKYPGVQGLKWLHSLQDGSSITQCVGTEVTFPWDYQLEGEEQLVGISWSRLQDGTTEKQSIAGFVFDKFESQLGTRVTQVKEGGAGLKMADLTTADSGSYTVIVRLDGQSVPQQSLTLIVAEMPETETGSLEVILSNETEADTSPSATNGYQQLLCGKFTSLGQPPVSVVWEDPDGKLLESTFFDTSSGYFVLSLPARYRGGNYHCMINETATAFSCLPSHSPLREKASLEVTAPVSRVTAAGMDSGTVAGIVIGVLAVVAAAVIITLVIVLKVCRRKGKKYSPKEPESPNQEVSEPFKT
ncbi:hypothetical protein BaRGS_00016611, partial [Batillaria attramentaria]